MQHFVSRGQCWRSDQADFILLRQARILIQQKMCTDYPQEMCISCGTIHKESSLTRLKMFSNKPREGIDGLSFAQAGIAESAPMKEALRTQGSKRDSSCWEDWSPVQVSNILLKVSLVFFLQLDHYPSVSYHLPSSSDTLFNSPKSLFLGKVIGKNSVLHV